MKIFCAIVAMVLIGFAFLVALLNGDPNVPSVAKHIKELSVAGFFFIFGAFLLYFIELERGQK